MEEQKTKPSANPSRGYLWIAIGIAGLWIQFSGDYTWSFIFIIKFIIAAGAIVFGIFLLTRKKIK